MADLITEVMPAGRSQTEAKKCEPRLLTEELPREADLSVTCPTCQIEMAPEHAHYRCLRCGYRDSCCF